MRLNTTEGDFPLLPVVYYCPNAKHCFAGEAFAVFSLSPGAALGMLRGDPGIWGLISRAI